MSTDYDAEDCYAVARLEGGGFMVKHYPDRETRRPCCKVKVEITDADRAQAIPDADPQGEAAALHRSYLEIEQRHGRR